MNDEETNEPIVELNLDESSAQPNEAPVDEFRNKYLRALADMENLKKRLQHEKKESIAYAIDNMLADFLTPLDSFENALAFTENLSPEMQSWALGFKMIANQFKEVLENHGIFSYDSVGKLFDPHIHEGVETIETDKVQEGIIVEEVVKGYKRGDRILRVAKVKVAKRKEKTTEGESHV